MHVELRVPALNAGESTYRVVEVFHTLQGEGVKAGVPMVFVRFAYCNLACSGETVGGVFQPVCDTYFNSGVKTTLRELVDTVVKEAGKTRWVCLTGGEPLLQVDGPLLGAFHDLGFKLAVETNGTRPLPPPGDYGGNFIDWVCCSPKVAEHALKVTECDEVKYVVHDGMPLPRTNIEADHYLLSPHFDGGDLDRRNLQWAIKLCKDSPPWRLSVQMHKVWGVR